jgi:hypothetical protein
VVKVQHSTDVPPLVHGPESVLASVGYPAEFHVLASGSAPLSYQWYRNDVEIKGATAETYRIEAVAIGDNQAVFRARVTNPVGEALSDPAVLTVTTNVPPVVTIVEPEEGRTYRAGDTISYRFTATDAETGPLGGDDVTWWVDFHHDEHAHPFIARTTGSLDGTFVIPTSGETSAHVWYRVHALAVDSIGLVHEAWRDVTPNTANLTVTSSVAGARFTLDGQTRTTPVTIEGVAGLERRLAIPEIQRIGGSWYKFESWSDGGAATREFSFPDSDTVLVADFRPVSVTYLSDLAFAETPVNGWGAVERDRSNGEVAPDDGHVITLGGVTFAKGLGVHALSEVRFNLDGQYAFFSASVGIDDETRGNGTAVFEVWGDGVLLHQTGVLGGLMGRRRSACPWMGYANWC